MRRLTCFILIIFLTIAANACHRASGGAPATAALCEVALAAHSGDAKVDREIARLQQEIGSNAKPYVSGISQGAFMSLRRRPETTKSRQWIPTVTGESHNRSSRLLRAA